MAAGPQALWRGKLLVSSPMASERWFLQSKALLPTEGASLLSWHKFSASATCLSLGPSALYIFGDVLQNV